ncbi:hypothetical protein AVEN_11092-1 [Araneus ventricosus]|uniref:Uncharacterized protein n=1 Tax=Araneus ventricosus TaxID=182803 RepID=A0A4Y2AST4_ARAVE|nr:hypothetical protein AVEN_11092-1 [Araneus ventricosus]
MIIASILNEEGCSSSMTSDPSVNSVVLSKSTIHRKRQRLRRGTAEQTKTQFITLKSVFHWDDKLIPDLPAKSTEKIDRPRLAVIVSSLQDGSTKLLSGSGKAAADDA